MKLAWYKSPYLPTESHFFAFPFVRSLGNLSTLEVLKGATLNNLQCTPKCPRNWAFTCNNGPDETPTEPQGKYAHFRSFAEPILYGTGNRSAIQ